MEPAVEAPATDAAAAAPKQHPARCEWAVASSTRLVLQQMEKLLPDLTPQCLQDSSVLQQKARLLLREPG